jgi:EF-P beta-lysylation protein EpmB
MQRQSLTTDQPVVLPTLNKDLVPDQDPALRQDPALGQTCAPEDFAGEDFAPKGNSGETRWVRSMKNAIRSASELREVLELPEEELPEESGDGDNDYDFPVFVTREFVSRMRKGDPNDPLLRQVLPTTEEGRVVDGFGSDPVGDLGANVAPGVLHKYHGRALMITTGACGIHCRYCFRREFPYTELGSRKTGYEPSLEYLRQRHDIEEIILSGGDPLTTTDESINAIITKIESVDHVSRLRIHTRMPIVVPSRVTSFLCNRLKQSRLTAWVVVHANHAAEIDNEAQAALERLVDAGIPTLNQSVLLRGVNDSVDALETLSRRLLDCRVIPYYLHQLDRVRGAAHFEVSVERGRELIDGLESRLPGFAVPRYVHEIAGRESKTRLSTTQSETAESETPHPAEAQSTTSQSARRRTVNRIE